MLRAVGSLREEIAVLRRVVDQCSRPGTVGMLRAPGNTLGAPVPAASVETQDPGNELTKRLKDSSAAQKILAERRRVALEYQHLNNGRAQVPFFVSSVPYVPFRSVVQ